MTPYDLLNRLSENKIDYGFYDYKHDKSVKPNDPEWQTAESFEELCRVLKPSEVWEKQIGTCWDLTLLEFDELTKMRYRPEVVYVETILPNKEPQTHTFVYFEEPKARGWYWFEYAWYMYCGLHGPFTSKNSLFNIIKQRITKDLGYKLVLWKEVKSSVFQKLLSIDPITVDIWFKHTRDA